MISRNEIQPTRHSIAAACVRVRRIALALTLFVSVGLMATLSAAQAAWPERPVTIVVPYAAGGAADVTVRIIAEKMTTLLGQPVLILNRPGSIVATTSLVRADPDGYTLMAAPMSHSMNIALHKKLPYDTFNDAVPIATFGFFNYVVIASKTNNLKDIGGLIAMLKASPGKYNFGSGGVGSPTHLVAELFQDITKTKATHVPYRADQQAMTDMMAGRIDFMVSSTVAAGGQVKNGNLVGLAVPSPKRSSSLPEVPTTAESGLPEFSVSSYYVLIAPKGTPSPIIDQINKAVNDALKDPAVSKRLADLDFPTGVDSTPDSTMKLIRAEADRWTPIIKNAGISLD